MSTDLSTFLSRKAKAQERIEKIAAWHLGAFVDGGVPLPYSHDDSWVNVNQYDQKTYELDAEASLDVLASVVQYASKLDGVTIEKSYSNDFELSIKTPDGITVRYFADREAVCTKRVVGTEEIPERVVPASTKEIIEWDCDPVSLLARNRDGA